MKKSISLIIILVFCLIIQNADAQKTATVGKSVSAVQLVDANNNPKAIPFLGDKVMMIFYMDVDARGVNNPLTDALKLKKYPKERLSGLGIINCKDTWVPISMIRKGIQKNEKQSAGSHVLLDTNLKLSKAWGLGDANDRIVVLIIGKDSKIKFIKTLQTEEDCKAIVPTFLKTIDKELLL